MFFPEKLIYMTCPCEVVNSYQYTSLKTRYLFEKILSVTVCVTGLIMAVIPYIDLSDRAGNHNTQHFTHNML